MSIVVPLLPTFALVLYNGIQLESLITRSNLLQKSFEQVSIFTHNQNVDLIEAISGMSKYPTVVLQFLFSFDLKGL